MKLVLRSFSQEIEVTDLTEASNYLVFEDEESGQVYRLPVLQETITALSGIIVGGNSTEEPAEVDEPEEEMPAEPEPPPPPVRKTLRGPRSEDEVPQL